MKKAYTKPGIYFDSFAMCTDIAGQCSYITNTPHSGTCGLEFSDSITVFVQNVSDCNFKVGGVMDGEYNGICFHVPAGNRNLFNS